MSRRLISVVLSFLAFFSIMTGVSEAASNSGEVAVPIKKSVSISIPLFAKKSQAYTEAVLDTPPLGACNYNTNFNGSARYVNGVLESTDFPFSTTITCTTTAPDQTFRYLCTSAEMYLNDKVRQPAAPNTECSHENSTQPLCQGLATSGRITCFSLSEVCSGVYYAIGGIVILLPDGWTFSKATDGCVLDSPSEQVCTLKTTNSTVSPTDP